MAVLLFQKIKNARDFSGIPTEDGHTIHNKSLIRSDFLYKATPYDMKRLKKDCKVNLVIDLRTQLESEEKPNVVVDGIEYVQIPLINEQMAGITRESTTDPMAMSKAASSRKAFRDSIPDLAVLYPQVAREPMSQQRLKEALTLIMDWIIEEKGAVLFHCTAGKDRTGVLSLCILSMLGVSREEIVTDYMQTNHAANKESYKYFILAIIFKLDPILAKKAYHAMHCEERFLDSLFAMMDNEYGSPMNYLTDCIGLEQKKIDLFREKMLKK